MNGYLSEIQVLEWDLCLRVDVLEVPAERVAAEPPPEAHALLEARPDQSHLIRAER